MPALVLGPVGDVGETDAVLVAVAVGRACVFVTIKSPLEFVIL